MIEIPFSFKALDGKKKKKNYFKKIILTNMCVKKKITFSVKSILLNFQKGLNINKHLIKVEDIQVL